MPVADLDLIICKIIITVVITSAGRAGELPAVMVEIIQETTSNHKGGKVMSFKDQALHDARCYS